MTVCIAALAEEKRAIACMADRALSYGDTIQWDSDSSKMFSLRNGGLVIMFAGSEEATSRILGKVIARESDLGNDIALTRKTLEEEYKEAVQEIIEARYLAPRLMSRQEYITSISGPRINTFVESIAKEIKAYVPDSALIVCGFDVKDKPFILYLDSPGVVTDMTITGFHSIGSGWEKSISKLLFSEYQRKNPVHVVMYEMFDAKAFAEMAVGVGFDWETRIITGHESGIEVPERIDKLIESGYAEHERSPWEKYDKDIHGEPPPKTWKATLRAFSRQVVTPTPVSDKKKKKNLKQ